MPNATTTPPTPDPLAEIVGRLDRILAVLESGPAEALSPAAAATFLDISVSKFHDLNTRGLLPSPALIGDSDQPPRWLRSELRAWLLADAPSRARWNMMKDAKMKHAAA